jgi:hypothetical protein
MGMRLLPIALLLLAVATRPACAIDSFPDINVHLQDTEGQPLAGAEVFGRRVLAPGDALRPVWRVADEKGIARISAADLLSTRTANPTVTKARYELMARAKGFVGNSQPIDLPLTKAASPTKITLSRGP